MAVIFPVSQGIGMGFKRRERALTELGNLLGNLKQVWGALHTWLVKTDGEWVTIADSMTEEQRVTPASEQLSSAASAV